jgi:nitrate/nitrite transporter NarK
VLILWSLPALRKNSVDITFWGLVIDSIPAQIMGTCLGTVNFGGQVAGFISPFIMGYLIDLNQGSFDMACLFLIIAAIASAVVALSVRNASET